MGNCIGHRGKTAGAAVASPNHFSSDYFWLPMPSWEEIDRVTGNPLNKPSIDLTRKIDINSSPYCGPAHIMMSPHLPPKYSVAPPPPLSSLSDTPTTVTSKTLLNESSSVASSDFYWNSLPLVRAMFGSEASLSVDD